MAITDIKQYAHLTAEDVEELAGELDAIRTGIEESRGERDARYVRRTIQLQRALAAGGRIALFASKNKVAWLAGTAMLATAKIIENMELGHNITHGQWDWMNDPEVPSTEWEWDTTSPSVHWKKSHNFIHHKYTNVVGLDDDIGYGIMRLTRDQRWEGVEDRQSCVQHAARNAFRVGRSAARGRDDEISQRREVDGRGPQGPANHREKIGKQVGKDYVVFPALTGKNWKHTLSANATRQYWQSFWTIFKLALPDKLLKATSDDAPETNSELKFRIREGVRESFGVDPATGKRRGLRTAVRELQAAAMVTA